MYLRDGTICLKNDVSECLHQIAVFRSFAKNTVFQLRSSLRLANAQGKDSHTTSGKTDRRHATNMEYGITQF